jgi:AcrR family transcriptional regulator
VNADEGRRERKKRARRSRIYETARHLFLEHGVAATTVEQIAEAADVAQTTFFNHFRARARWSARWSAKCPTIFMRPEPSSRLRHR